MVKESTLTITLTGPGFTVGNKGEINKSVNSLTSDFILTALLETKVRTHLKEFYGSVDLT